MYTFTCPTTHDRAADECEPVPRELAGLYRKGILSDRDVSRVASLEKGPCSNGTAHCSRRHVPALGYKVKIEDALLDCASCGKTHRVSSELREDGTVISGATVVT